MKKLIFIATFINYAFALNAQDTLRLEEAINLGLEYNFEIALAENQAQIAANNYTVGNAGFLPRADLSGNIGWTQENTRQEFVSGNTQEVEGAQTRRINATALVNWLIFDGGRMFLTYEKLNQLRIAEDLSKERVIENIAADIIDGYYLVVLQQERVRVLQNNLILSKERKDIAKAKYDIGKASKLEYLAAQVDYNADTSALLQQVEALYQAKVNLNNVMGVDVNHNFAVKSNINYREDLPQEVLKEEMLANNLQLRIIQRQENVAVLELKEIKAEMYPQLRLDGGYEINRLNAEAGFLLSRRSAGFNYGATATFNIFNGFNRQRREQNARIQLQNTGLLNSQLTLDLEAQFNNLYSDYSSSLVLLQMERENLAVAQENADIALDRYNIGNTNSLELREAQQNLVDAESRLLNAAYTVKMAETELLRISGQLIGGMEN